MKRFFLSLMALGSFQVSATEAAPETAWWQQLESEVAIEGRYFTQEKGFGADYSSSSSLRFETEYYTSWNDKKDSFTLVPFLRGDNRDGNRSHFDLREATWVHVADDYELRAGLRKEFWGVTESQHLVDIINQTDFVENLDGEDKLGQPMINLSFQRDWGLLDVYVLTGFRERTFPGRNARLRAPLLVEDHAIYESSAKQRRVDFAMRWKQYFGNLDVGLSYFSGTSRDPRFALNASPIFLGGVPYLHPEIHKLVPVYDVIDQLGLDLQYIYEGWAFKLEAISRHGQCWNSQAIAGLVHFCSDAYTAGTAGFEYTQVGIFGTWADLGWVVEVLLDDRGDQSPSTAEQDVLVGTRWTLNDAASTEALIGVIVDSETEERMLSIEASRRLSDNMKITLEGRAFSHTSAPGLLIPAIPDNDNKLSPFQREDFIQAEFIYYF